MEGELKEIFEYSENSCHTLHKKKGKNTEKVIKLAKKSNTTKKIGLVYGPKIIINYILLKEK